jgi:hypothetical protein
MSNFKKIWYNNDLRQLILQYIKYNECLLCKNKPENIHNNVDGIALYMDGICIDCLIK